MSIKTLAIDRSMPQLGHNPHGYNLMNYQCHYYWVRSGKLSIVQLGHNPQEYSALITVLEYASFINERDWVVSCKTDTKEY